MTVPPHPPAGRETLVIGLGNPYRRDDAAGLAVAARIRAAGLPGVNVTEFEGDTVSLLDVWDGAGQVYLADAVSSGGEAGTVYRFDAITELPPPAMRHRGTHTFSLADTIELGRVLGRLPLRLVAYGIEAAEFGTGAGLSAPVQAAVSAVAARLTGELTAASDGPAAVPGPEAADGPAQQPPHPG